MSLQQFRYPAVEQELGLTAAEADLFAGVAPLALPPEFVDRMAYGANLASAIHTEKARSEFVVAPMLIELHRLLAGRFGLFSGVELNADPVRGLNGVCDFVLTKTARQRALVGPLLTIVAAKNEAVRDGFGQCIAAMVAAQMMNDAAHTPIPAVYGAVTTGTNWMFLRVRGAALTIDTVEYLITALPKVMGILRHIVEAA